LTTTITVALVAASLAGTIAAGVAAHAASSSADQRHLVGELAIVVVRIRRFRSSHVGRVVTCR
jgi:hypothetical protein